MEKLFFNRNNTLNLKFFEIAKHIEQYNTKNIKLIISRKSTFKISKKFDYVFFFYTN